MTENLELRMYCFVPYQLTGIQKGIQSLHAVVQYGKAHGGRSSDYFDWADNWNTVIVLDGGTTNDVRYDDQQFGTLNMIRDVLSAGDTPFAWFREPDFQDALTAVCFIADERVFNTKKYPNWEDGIIYQQWEQGKVDASVFLDAYGEWLDGIGGTKNRMLRELIEGKKLATN